MPNFDDQETLDAYCARQLQSIYHERNAAEFRALMRESAGMMKLLDPFRGFEFAKEKAGD
jgi:hypothetical protein